MLFRSRIAGTEVLDMRQPRIKSPPRERQRLGRGVSRRLVRGGECDSNACFRRHTTLNTPCNRKVARLCQDIHLHPKTNPKQKRPALLRAVKVEVAGVEPASKQGTPELSTCLANRLILLLAPGRWQPNTSPSP